MIKNIGFFILGVLLSLSIQSAWAIYESDSGNANSVVAYGITSSSVLTAFLVDSNGVLQVN